MNPLIQALFGKENKVPIGLLDRLDIWGCRTEALVHQSPNATVFSISGKIDGFYIQIGKRIGAGGIFEVYSLDEADELITSFFSSGFMEQTKSAGASEFGTFRDAIRSLDPRTHWIRTTFFEMKRRTKLGSPSLKFVKAIRRRSGRTEVFAEASGGDEVTRIEFTPHEFETLCNDIRAHTAKS